MDKEIIKQLEDANNGMTIHLFYDEMVGMYAAFGLSAYYTTMVTEPFMSYSEEMKMPVALLRKEHILYLRQSLTKIEHTQKQYYQFQMRTLLGGAGYERWAQNILRKHQQIKT